jgi:hypothetical protein
MSYARQKIIDRLNEFLGWIRENLDLPRINKYSSVAVDIADLIQFYGTLHIFGTPDYGIQLELTLKRNDNGVEEYIEVEFEIAAQYIKIFSLGIPYDTTINSEVLCEPALAHRGPSPSTVIEDFSTYLEIRVTPDSDLHTVKMKTLEHLGHLIGVNFLFFKNR